MKMFLRTLFGISQHFYSGSDEQPFQGMVQGNGAAPPVWLIISIFLVRYLYSKRVVSHLMIPISGLVVALAALIYVDDTDLYVFNDSNSSAEEVVNKAQVLVDTWHAVLQLTGGDLKLSKCY